MNVSGVRGTDNALPDPSQDAAAATQDAAAATVSRGAAPARPDVTSAAAHGESAFGTGTVIANYNHNGELWHRQALSPKVNAAATALGPDPDMPVVVADLKVPPAALKTACSADLSMVPTGHGHDAELNWSSLSPDQQTWLKFVHDALMLAPDHNPTKDKWGVFDPPLDPTSEQCSAKKVNGADAFKEILPVVLSNNGVGPDDLKDLTGQKLADAKQKAADLTANLRQVIQPMLHDKGFEIYQAHWDNTDDTQRDGILAVNKKTGEVRMLVAINPP